MKTKKRHRNVEIQMPSLRRYERNVDVSTDTSDLSNNCSCRINNNNNTSSEETTLTQVTIESAVKQKRIVQKAQSPRRLKLLSNYYLKKWMTGLDNPAFAFNPHDEIHFRRNTLPLTLYNLNRKENNEFSWLAVPPLENVSSAITSGDVGLHQLDINDFQADDLSLLPTTSCRPSTKRGSKRKRKAKHENNILYIENGGVKERKPDAQDTKRYHHGNEDIFVYENDFAYPKGN